MASSSASSVASASPSWRSRKVLAQACVTGTRAAREAAASSDMARKFCASASRARAHVGQRPTCGSIASPRARRVWWRQRSLSSSSPPSPPSCRVNEDLPKELNFNGREVRLYTFDDLESLGTAALKQRALNLRDLVGPDPSVPRLTPGASAEQLVLWLITVQCLLMGAAGQAVSPQDFGAPSDVQLAVSSGQMGIAGGVAPDPYGALRAAPSRPRCIRSSNRCRLTRRASRRGRSRRRTRRSTRRLDTPARRAPTRPPTPRRRRSAAAPKARDPSGEPSTQFHPAPLNS